MIFWIVERVKSILKGKNFEIKGNQKWNGGILSLINKEENRI